VRGAHEHADGGGDFAVADGDEAGDVARQRRGGARMAPVRTAGGELDRVDLALRAERAQNGEPVERHGTTFDNKDNNIELGLLLDAIFQTYHYDFRSYAPASLKRRVRSALSHFGCETISRLQERVLREPKLFSELLRFLTVQVSDLFRDPSYYRSLREKVVPYLRTYPSLKVWVAGCATGEEAYSLAILLAEEQLLDRTLIYATDINPESLRAAEAGIYQADRFKHFSENYLAAGGRLALELLHRTLFFRGLRSGPEEGHSIFGPQPGHG